MTSPTIAENLKSVLDEIGPAVSLVAVSKTHPASVVQEAYDAGQRIFGENKVQELLAKQPVLPEDIHWHLIGHLQSNKIKFIAPFISLIHSVDSHKLLEAISAAALRNSRVIDCLLQVHIAEEESKFGFDRGELWQMLDSLRDHPLAGVRIRGLMGMATFTDDMNQVRREFAGLRSLWAETRHEFFPDDRSFDQLSMGMSGDYRIAIEEGSTMVRIGTRIFGSRSLKK
jgi:pyridoxal phosphate enzyme (YggS family)